MTMFFMKALPFVLLCLCALVVQPVIAERKLGQDSDTGVFSPYKDIGIGLDWNTNAIGSDVTGVHTTVSQAMPDGLSTITLAFATGECGSDNWSTIPGATLASANVQALIDAGKQYIVATGGANGPFKCSTTAGFNTFLNQWNSSHLLGVDFDIEVGQSRADIDNLVARVQEAQDNFPDLRFSFTLAAFPTGNGLDTTGDQVMQSIKAAGLTDYYINLIAFDFGDEACSKDAAGKCDLGQSAIDAANTVHSHYGIPYSQIELTPMIGGTDVVTEIFTLDMAGAVSNFAVSQGLAGVHFWSFDRDRDCPPGTASGTCNTYGEAGTLGFTNKFLQSLPGWSNRLVV